MEPRAGLEPATGRFLRQHHLIGFTRFIPHHTSRFGGIWQVLFRSCSEKFAVMSRNLTRNLEVRNLPDGPGITRPTKGIEEETCDGITEGFRLLEDCKQKHDRRDALLLLPQDSPALRDRSLHS